MAYAGATFYDVLGLSPAATDADVRRAYHSLALRWHPDRNPQNRDKATEYCALLNRAYAHLRTAPQRQAYDRYIAALAAPRALPTPGKRKEPPYLICLLRAIFWPVAPLSMETLENHG